jgi:hypothetical protein
MGSDFSFLDAYGLGPADAGDVINDLISSIQAGDLVLSELQLSPRHQLAFRTFAWLRAGIVLGQLLMERDLRPQEGRWVEELLADSEVREVVVEAVQKLGYQIASDPELVHARAVRPDPEARLRFLEHAQAALQVSGGQPTPRA